MVIENLIIFKCLYRALKELPLISNATTYVDYYQCLCCLRNNRNNTMSSLINMTIAMLKTNNKRLIRRCLIRIYRTLFITLLINMLRRNNEYDKFETLLLKGACENSIDEFIKNYINKSDDSVECLLPCCFTKERIKIDGYAFNFRESLLPLLIDNKNKKLLYM